jgi:hypothetical protein
MREPIEPDEDGHCKRCGYLWPDENETTEPHECPPGFLDEADRLRARLAALESRNAALEKAFQHYFHDGAEDCRQCGLPRSDLIHTTAALQDQPLSEG